MVYLVLILVKYLFSRQLAHERPNCSIGELETGSKAGRRVQQPQTAAKMSISEIIRRLEAVDGFFCFFFFFFVFFYILKQKKKKKTFDQDDHVTICITLDAFLYGVLTLHSVSNKSIDD